jgi:hypothetical protein
LDANVDGVRELDWYLGEGLIVDDDEGEEDEVEIDADEEEEHSTSWWTIWSSWCLRCELGLLKIRPPPTSSLKYR